MQGSLLASFGFRTLAILRAVKSGVALLDETKSILLDFGLAVMDSDGNLSLTFAGEAMLAYLEKLELIPEEHVEFIEAVSDGTTSRLRARPK